MPGNMPDTMENAVLDHLVGNATLTITGPMKGKLCSNVGSDATPGTVLTGNGYADATMTFAAASSGSIATNSLTRWNSNPQADVLSVELYDSTGTPKRIAYGPLDGPSYTVVASTDVFTSTAHGFTDAQKIAFAPATGSNPAQNPTGASANTVYYTRDCTANTFKIAATPGGAAIDITADVTVAQSSIRVRSIAVATDPFEIASGAFVLSLD